MPELPFDIPKSLSVYVEQFEEDPLKVTTKLKNHLNRRGPDAVGYFLLAWFYYLKGLKDTAVDYALAAKTFAPGSPLMEKLHYYLSHPNTFNAWTPSGTAVTESRAGSSAPGPEPVLDLDNLIEKLSKVENARIKIPEGEEDIPEEPSESDEFSDEIVSETLAKIHETQGKTKEAIRTYERLKKLNSEKKDYYSEQITRLQESLKNKPGKNKDNGGNEE